MPIHGGTGGWDLQGSAPIRGCAAFLASCSAWHKVISGKAASVLGSQALPLTLSLENHEELNLQLPLPHGESWEGSGGAAASRDRGMGGGKVTHQNHLPCSDGTMGLSPEQTSPSEVLPSSSSTTQPFVQPGWEMTCDSSGKGSSAQT